MGVDVDPKTHKVGAAASANIYDPVVIHIGREIKARDPKNVMALHVPVHDGRFITRIGHGTDPTSR